MTRKRDSMGSKRRRSRLSAARFVAGKASGQKKLSSRALARRELFPGNVDGKLPARVRKRGSITFMVRPTILCRVIARGRALLLHEVSADIVHDITDFAAAEFVFEGHHRRACFTLSDTADHTRARERTLNERTRWGIKVLRCHGACIAAVAVTKIAMFVIETLAGRRSGWGSGVRSGKNGVDEAAK